MGGREGSGDLGGGDLATWGRMGPSAPAAAGRSGMEQVGVLACPAVWECVSMLSSVLPMLQILPYQYAECSNCMHAGSIRNGKPSTLLRRSGPAGPSVLDTSLAKRMRAETHSQCAIFCVSLYVVHTSTLADSILVSISLL